MMFFLNKKHGPLKEEKEEETKGERGREGRGDASSQPPAPPTTTTSPVQAAHRFQPLPLITGLNLWPLIIGIFLWPFIIDSTCGLEISSTGQSHIYMARGESVNLYCHFVLASEDIGQMDIEWSIIPSDIQAEEKVVVWYTGERIYDVHQHHLKGRVYFNSPEPQNGNASITITDLKFTDTDTYQCKVRKLPGISSRKIHLTVMERPSKPMCYTEGPIQVGKDLVLRCMSTKGTPPLQYSWTKTTGNKGLPPSSVVNSVSGDLYLDSIKEVASGTYLCMARNFVGMEQCDLILSFTSSLSMAGIIAVAVVSVLLVFIIPIIIYCCCRKKQEEEFGNDILEDEPPPHIWLSEGPDAI